MAHVDRVDMSQDHVFIVKNDESPVSYRRLRNQSGLTFAMHDTRYAEIPSATRDV